jgi:hypothetical protein
MPILKLIMQDINIFRTRGYFCARAGNRCKYVGRVDGLISLTDNFSHKNYDAVGWDS